MKEKLICDGNFSPLVRGVLCFGGMAIGFLGLKYDRTLIVALIGLAIGAIGGYSSRAHMLGIKPFDSYYKKARDSYKTKDGEEDR
ncbi:hypothetical protein ACV229_40240 [Burkholderia sp. MR1-5-21]